MLSRLGTSVCPSLRKGAPFTCRRASHAWTATAQKAIKGNLKTIEEEGTWKKERIITGRQGAHIRVEKRDSSVINFCANNYLGLSVRILFLILLTETNH